MSRGGRGRGRGGRPNIPGYDHDASLMLDSKPSELFPPYRVPVAAIPTEKEKREVAFYLGLREQIHEGPLYTAPQARDAKPTKVYGEDQFNNQFHNKLKPDIDPFEGMPLYSWKYDQEKRTLPELSARSFDKNLFPKELWPTLDGEEGKAVRNTINKGLKKKAGTSNVSAKEKGGLNNFEKIKNIFETDEAGAEGEREEEEEDGQEEEEDYDYEDDEAEMGGDYGAEQYFDGGEGDDDDGMDGGRGDEY